ncbi:MAG: HAD family hydrolase [bacterium]
MKQPAIFFDRDGTLIVDKYYLNDPEQVELIPGALEALKLARKLGFQLFVVSNQSGIARGISTEEQVRAVNERIVALLASEGIELDGLAYCPHHPDDEPACNCRKPARGMVDQFLKSFELELKRSYVIGDSKADIGLGHNIGATSILVQTGYEQLQREHFSDSRRPDHIAADILAAVKWIAEYERE